MPRTIKAFYLLLRIYISLLILLLCVLIVEISFDSLVYAQNNASDYTQNVGYSYCRNGFPRVPEYCVAEWCLERDPSRVSLTNYPVCNVNSDAGYACTTEKDCPRDILCRQSFEDSAAPTFTGAGFIQCVNSRCVSYCTDSDRQWMGNGAGYTIAGDKIRYSFINAACMNRFLDFDGVVRREARARHWYFINKYDDLTCDDSSGIGRIRVNVDYFKDNFDGSSNTFSFFVHDVDTGFPVTPLTNPSLATRKCRNEVGNNNEIWDGIGCGTFYDSFAVSTSNFRNVNTSNFGTGNVRFDAGIVQRGYYMAKIRLQGVDTSSSGVPDSDNWPKPCTILLDQSGWRFPNAVGLGNNFGNEVISGLPRTDDDCTLQYGSHYIDPASITSTWVNGNGANDQFRINFTVRLRGGWGDGGRRINPTVTMWYIQPIIDDPSRWGDLPLVLVDETVCSNATGQSACSGNNDSWISPQKMDIVRSAWITPPTVANTLIDNSYSYIGEPGTKIFPGTPGKWYLLAISGVNATGSCQKQGTFAVKCGPQTATLNAYVRSDPDWNTVPDANAQAQIEVRNSAGTLVNTGNDINGNNTFSLAPGIYSVRMIPQPGSFSTLTGSTAGDVTNINVPAGGSASITFMVAPIPTGTLTYSGICTQVTPTTCQPRLTYTYTNIPASCGPTKLLKRPPTASYSVPYPLDASFGTIDTTGSSITFDDEAITNGATYNYQHRTRWNPSNPAICRYYVDTLLGNADVNATSVCPVAPQNLTTNALAVACSTNSVTLSWNHDPLASAYNIRVDDGVAGDSISAPASNCAVSDDLCVDNFPALGNCAGGICNMTITITNERTYSWRVQSVGAGICLAGPPPESIGPNFSVPYCRFTLSGRVLRDDNNDNCATGVGVPDGERIEATRTVNNTGLPFPNPSNQSTFTNAGITGYYEYTGLNSLIGGDSYSVQYLNLPAGGVPDDYKTISRRIQPPVSPFTSGSSASLPVLSANMTVDFCISNVAPWLQTESGDVRFATNTENKVPLGKLASPNANPSLFISSLGTFNILTGRISGRGWLANGEAGFNSPIDTAGSLSYTYFVDLIKKRNLPSSILTCSGVCNITSPSNEGIQLVGNLNPIPGGYTLTHSGFPTIQVGSPGNARKVIYLVNGDLTLDKNIDIVNGSIIIAAKGNITISQDVGANPGTPPALSDPADASPHLEGIFTAEGNITIQGSGCADLATRDKRLNVAGTLIANSRNPFNASGTGGKLEWKNRSLCPFNDAQYPVLKMTDRFDIFPLIDENIKPKEFRWQEVKP